MDAFGQVSMCASVLMIVALTFERHFAIRAPHTVISIFFFYYVPFGDPLIKRKMEGFFQTCTA